MAAGWAWTWLLLLVPVFGWFFFPFFFLPELRVERQKTEEETGCDGNERPRRVKVNEGRVEVRSAKDEGQNCQLPKAKGKEMPTIGER